VLRMVWARVVPEGGFHGLQLVLQDLADGDGRCLLETAFGHGGADARSTARPDDHCVVEPAHAVPRSAAAISRPFTYSMWSHPARYPRAITFVATSHVGRAAVELPYSNVRRGARLAAGSRGGLEGWTYISTAAPTH
jgi:hypothetical protein